MLKDIIAAQPVGDHRLYLRFEDGVEGEIDLAPVLGFRGVFEPLKDPAYFALVTADLDPDVLYARLTGTTILMQDAHQAR
jgi:hypothetical protein